MSHTQNLLKSIHTMREKHIPIYEVDNGLKEIIKKSSLSIEEKKVILRNSSTTIENILKLNPPLPKVVTNTSLINLQLNKLYLANMKSSLFKNIIESSSFPVNEVFTKLIKNHHNSILNKYIEFNEIKSIYSEKKNNYVLLKINSTGDVLKEINVILYDKNGDVIPHISSEFYFTPYSNDIKIPQQNINYPNYATPYTKTQCCVYYNKQYNPYYYKLTTTTIYLQLIIRKILNVIWNDIVINKGYLPFSIREEDRTNIQTVQIFDKYKLNHCNGDIENINSTLPYVIIKNDGKDEKNVLQNIKFPFTLEIYKSYYIESQKYPCMLIIKYRI